MLGFFSSLFGYLSLVCKSVCRFFFFDQFFMFTFCYACFNRFPVHSVLHTTPASVLDGTAHLRKGLLSAWNLNWSWCLLNSAFTPLTWTAAPVVVNILRSFPAVWVWCGQTGDSKTFCSAPSVGAVWTYRTPWKGHWVVGRTFIMRIDQNKGATCDILSILNCCINSTVLLHFRILHWK